LAILDAVTGTAPTGEGGSNPPDYVVPPGTQTDPVVNPDVKLDPLPVKPVLEPAKPAVSLTEHAGSPIEASHIAEVEGHEDINDDPKFRAATKGSGLSSYHKALLAQCCAPWSVRTNIQLPVGAGDMTTVKRFVKQTTISLPASMAESGITTFSVHIFTMPQMVGSSTPAESSVNWSGIGAQYETVGALVRKVGPLNLTAGEGINALYGAILVAVCLGPDEDLTFDLITTMNRDRIHVFTIPESVNPRSANMLTSFAYKVENTTPELYQGGAVMDYRQEAIPRVAGISSAILGPVGTGGFPSYQGSNTRQTYVIGPPPQNTEQAAPLSSVFRKATLGSLVTMAIDYESLQPRRCPESAFAFNSPMEDAVFQAKVAAASNRYCHLYYGIPPHGTGHGGSFTLGVLPENWDYTNLPPQQILDTTLPLMRTYSTQRQGSIYTGLPAQTTLVITSWATLEVAVATDDPFLSVASTSPLRDEHSLNLAQTALNMLPAGQPASHNSLGTFLRGVVGIASKVARPLASVLSHAPGRVGMVARGASAIMGPEQPRSERRAKASGSEVRRERIRANPAAPRVSVTERGSEEVIRIHHGSKGKKRAQRR